MFQRSTDYTAIRQKSMCHKDTDSVIESEEIIFRPNKKML